MGGVQRILAIGLLASVACAAPALAAAECKLNMLGELPLIMENGVPLVLGKIAGRDVLFLVDTSSGTSSINAATVETFGLKPYELENTKLVTADGLIRAMAVKVTDFNFGKFRGRNGVFLLSGDRSERIAGRIGQDYLSAVDVEYDLANGMMRFFQPKGCDKHPLSYWSPNYSLAVFDRYDMIGANRLQSAVEVNGQSYRAWFSTVARTSVLGLDAAARAGLTPQMPGAERAPSATPGGPRHWLVPVQSFGLGEETIKNTRLRIGEWIFQPPRESETGSHIRRNVVELPEMLIGTDYFLSHRIYVANSQRKLYFTYNGGGVFRREPGQ